MVNRQDSERRRRYREREEQLRRDRRGPLGFTQEDWSQVRRPSRPVQNPLDEQDDYSMRYREDWEQEDDWSPGPEHERWIDYGRDYDPRFENKHASWRQGGRSRWEDTWQGNSEERYFQPHEEKRRWSMRGRSRQGRNDNQMDYGRGVYEQRREKPEGNWRKWDTSDEYEDESAYSYPEFWLTPGPFTGVGPKGYQRSDESIFEDICYRMSVNGLLDPSEIDVKVENGEVTLEGRAQDRFSKRLAEAIAESVSGVSDVHNRIRVGRRADQDRYATREGIQDLSGGRTEDIDEQ